MLYVMLFFVVVIFFFSGMVALFTFNDLLYFTEGKNGRSIYFKWVCIYVYNYFTYVSMYFSSMLCKRGMFVYTRWFVAMTEISRTKNPCRLVSMSCPPYDSPCKWLYLRRISVGLSTMVPQALHLHFSAKQTSGGKFYMYSLRST